MCDEKIKEMQELETALDWLITPEMSLEKKKRALENSFFRSHNAGYCDYMAGQRMAGVEDGQVEQHDLDCKYKYEVERLLDLLEEQKNEEFAVVWEEASALVEKDSEAAFHAFLALCEEGYHRAAHSVAWCYRFGKGVEQNNEKAEEYYRLAISRNYDNSYYGLYYFLLEQGREEEALKLAKDGVLCRSCAAYSLLSGACMEGKVYGGNELVSAYLAARAFEINENDSFQLGYCYFCGVFFPTVYPYAKYCFEKSGYPKEELLEIGMELPEFWDDVEPLKPSYPPFKISYVDCDRVANPAAQFQEAQELFYGENPDVERGKELLTASVGGGYAPAMYRMFLKDMPDYEKWLRLGADGYGELRCIETLAALYTDCANFKIGDPCLNIAVHFWNLRKKLHAHIPVDELVIDSYNEFNTKFAAMLGRSAGKPSEDGNAVLLRADGSYERITVDFDTLEGLYAPIDCDRINIISTRALRDVSDRLGFTVVMYCDERGMQKNLPENARAAEISGYDVIWGDVVICGFKDDYAPLCTDEIEEVCEFLYE